jgi:signal transduction histidine kinase
MDTSTAILNRIEQKKEDYAAYGFEKLEMAALSTFFDLAQEYDSLENLYIVSVTVPRVFFEIRSNLYLIDPKTEAITWVANSHLAVSDPEGKVPPYIEITDAPYQYGDSYVVPIHGKKTPTSHILFYSPRGVIGIFEVIQARHLTEAQFFFIQKYVNRIGYNLYNKFLTEQNIQHLKFINNLVADIEHNVIVPNIRYQYYFRKIRKYLNRHKDIERDLDSLLDEVKSRDLNLYAKMTEIMESVIVINRAMFRDQEEIEQHYKHTSLFLETLFRADHFLFGEYILRKTPCYFWQDIVVPQLERYRDRFVQQGIKINHIIKNHKVSEDLQVKADKGLMAQVVANLFSNAAKYVKRVVDPSGKKVRKVDCTMSLIENFFGQGLHGVHFDVFSSGPPIDQKDAAHIFDEGFRLAQKPSVEGTGHGLHFVKNVVEVHGGVVGHEAEEFGNEFYFIIPV